jgi:hypothetical protein
VTSLFDAAQAWRVDRAAAGEPLDPGDDRLDQARGAGAVAGEVAVGKWPVATQLEQHPDLADEASQRGRDGGRNLVIEPGDPLGSAIDDRRDLGVLGVIRALDRRDFGFGFLLEAEALGDERDERIGAALFSVGGRTWAVGGNTPSMLRARKHFVQVFDLLAFSLHSVQQIAPVSGAAERAWLSLHAGRAGVFRI